eukprot:Seg2632.3 transcript_id=Seg2632.3/GoldUCD/mRNA.D3Y31 product="GPI ethanolamine phosphate transferase 3" protein_id=Seg2632.3/GoldUCD/D3Y31
MIKDSKENAKLFKFIADPPTTTMQRLKGLTTGSLPTFVDASANFGSSEILEDNLLYQFHAHNKSMVFMGDDTWLDLYPRYFTSAFPFPSLDVKDLDTVDDGVISHLIPEVTKNDWDVIIAHFLGVDHCGHRYGPTHPEMERKLKQMDSVIKNLTEHLDNETMLYVFGDHGMTQTGDHGGDSNDEVMAALFAYSKRNLFKPTKRENDLPTAVSQVDIVPTLALQMNISIPFSNIGSVIQDVFVMQNHAINHSKYPTVLDEPNSQLSLLMALRENAIQVKTYLEEYSKLSNDLSGEKLSSLNEQFQNAEKGLSNSLEGGWKEGKLGSVNGSEAIVRQSIDNFKGFIQNVLKTCREIWAKFDLPLMVVGIHIMILAIILCICQNFAMCYDKAESEQTKSQEITTIDTIGVTTNIASWLIFLNSSLDLQRNIISTAFQGLSICCMFSGTTRSHLFIGARNVYKSTDLFSIVMLLLYTSMLFSNSFTLSENSVLLSVLQTLLIYRTIKEINTSMNPARKEVITHLEKAANKKLKRRKEANLDIDAYKMILTLLPMIASICSRISMMFWSCREEESRCEASSFVRPLEALLHDSSVLTLRLRQSLAVFSVVLVIILIYYRCKKCGSLIGVSSVSVTIKMLLPVSAVCILLHWLLQIPIKNKLGEILHIQWTQQVLLPRIVYLLLLIAIVLLLWDPLSVYVVIRSNKLPWKSRISSGDTLDENIQVLFKDLRDSLSSDKTPDGEDTGFEPPLVYGLGTVYSTPYYTLMAVLALLLMVLLKDGLSFSIVLMIVSGLCLRMDSQNGDDSLRGTNIPAIVTWSILASYWFFATGHQATIPSIRFDAAFIGLQGDSGGRVLPALLILLNTFSSHIFFALSLPLLHIWQLTSNRDKTDLSTNDESKNALGGNDLGDMSLRQDPQNVRRSLVATILCYLAVQMFKVVTTAIVASFHRRHLMVWRIFGPRYVFEAAGFLVSLPFLLLGLVFYFRIDNAVERWTLNLEQLNKIS